MKNLIIVILLAIICFFVGNNVLSEIQENTEKSDTRTPMTLDDNIARQVAEQCMEQYINETEGYKASIPALNYVIKREHRPIRYKAVFNNYSTWLSDDKNNLCIEDFYTFIAREPKYYTNEMLVYCCKPRYDGPSLFDFR